MTNQNNKKMKNAGNNQWTSLNTKEDLTFKDKSLKSDKNNQWTSTNKL